MQEKILWRSVVKGVEWEIISRKDGGVERRFLVNGGCRMQSGIVVEEGGLVPAFQYARTMVEEATQGYGNILILGAGAFSIPTCIMAASPATRITVVDTESWLEGISQRYFFKPTSDHLTFIKGDASVYTGERGGIYDLVLIDVFSSSGLVPESFFSRDFSARIASLMTPGGALVWNVSLGRDTRWRRISGRVISTLNSEGLDVRAFCHPGQNHSARCNVLFVHNNRNPLGDGGWENYECEWGEGEFSQESPLIWPDKSLQTGGFRLVF
jgi:hypothetical protein